MASSSRASRASRASLVLVVANLAMLLARTASAQEYDTVETRGGAVRGAVLGATRAFRGIPFGQPPVGPLRFASPQSAAPWAPEVYDALDIAAACPGSRIQAVLSLFQRVDVDEDCLYLNVYTPVRDRITRPLPVLFWIYGGAFLLGDGWGGGLYNGEYTTATRDVIVVTHNYRLGPFGFLVSPDGQGNYGLEDQRLALQWVVDNIAAFGGDPTNITIYGESAGGMSVAAHMVSPRSRGLFQQAIIQSDPFTISTKSRELSLQTGAAFADKLNCTFDLACLRTKTTREIASSGNVGPAGKVAVIADLITWGPTVDGDNLLAPPLAAFRNGDAMDIPVVIGTNADEADLFSDIVDIVLRVVSVVLRRNISITLYEDEYRLLIQTIFRDQASAVLGAYPPLPNNASNYAAFMDLVTVYMFQCPTRQVPTGRPAVRFVYSAVRQAALGLVANNVQGPVYTYTFTHASTRPILGRYLSCYSGASCHAQELPYVWHLGLFTDAEEAMSQAMIDYWTGFASGDINARAEVVWPVLDATTQPLLNIRTGIVTTAWDQATCDFWDSVGYIY